MLLCSTAAELELLSEKEIPLFPLPFSRNVSCPKHHKILFSIAPILAAMWLYRLSDELLGLSSLCSHFRSSFMSLCLCDQEEGEGFTLDRDIP